MIPCPSAFDMQKVWEFFPSLSQKKEASVSSHFSFQQQVIYKKKIARPFEENTEKLDFENCRLLNGSYENYTLL